MGLSGFVEGSQQDNDQETTTEGGGAESPPSELVTQAQEEGTLSFLASMDEPDFREFFEPRWNERFPWSTLNFSSQTNVDIASQVRSASRAGNLQTDAIMIDIAVGTVTEEAGIFKDPSGIAAMELVKSKPYPESSYGEFHLPGYGNPVVVYYNENNVSESELPDNYFGLTDDKWQDRLIMQSPASLSSTGGLFATLRATWGVERFEEFAQGLLDNNISIIGSNSDSYRTVAQGEKDVCFGLINDLLGALNAGEDPPVQYAWKTMNPVKVQKQNPGYLLQDVPHPNMAELFMWWFHTDEAQIAVAETGRYPTNPEIASEEFGEAIPEDVSFKPVAFNDPQLDGQGYYEAPDVWREYYEELGLGIGG